MLNQTFSYILNSKPLVVAGSIIIGLSLFLPGLGIIIVLYKHLFFSLDFIKLILLSLLFSFPLYLLSLIISLTPVSLVSTEVKEPTIIILLFKSAIITHFVTYLILQLIDFEKISIQNFIGYYLVGTISMNLTEIIKLINVFFLKGLPDKKSESIE